MMGPRIRACELECVVSLIGPNDLCKRVNERLAQGWELQGLPMYANNEGKERWTQYLVRTELVIPEAMANQMQMGGGIQPATIVPNFRPAR